MYKFLKGVPKIIINLPAGLFSFQRESAVGKTYLSKQLRELRGLGEPVDSFSVEDLRRGNLEHALSASDMSVWDLKVLLLDRYDLYTRRFEDEIYKLGKTCTVLIDCKHSSYLQDVHDCKIVRDLTTIEVRGYGLRV